MLGVSGFGEEDSCRRCRDDAEQPLIDLLETYRDLSSKNLLESFHDAQQALDQALNLFSLGYLPLKQRCLAENLYWADLPPHSCGMAKQLDVLPRGVGRPRRHAVGHLLLQFLAVPEHARQLGREAAVSHHADSPARAAARRATRCWAISPATRDGKVDQFIDRRDVKKTLPLHPLNDEPYYLGAFLVGAYQEILGDLHNLVRRHQRGARQPERERRCRARRGHSRRHRPRGARVRAVPGIRDLLEQFRQDVEARCAAGKIGYEESGHLLKFYEEGLHGYTYLEDARSYS